MPSFRALPFALLILPLAGCSDAVAPRAAAPLAVEQPDLAVTASVPIIVRFPVSFTIPGGTCGLTTTVQREATGGGEGRGETGEEAELADELVELVEQASGVSRVTADRGIGPFRAVAVEPKVQLEEGLQMTVGFFRHKLGLVPR